MRRCYVGEARMRFDPRHVVQMPIVEGGTEKPHGRMDHNVVVVVCPAREARLLRKHHAPFIDRPLHQRDLNQRRLCYHDRALLAKV